jgi:hypothetical protein
LFSAAAAAFKRVEPGRVLALFGFSLRSRLAACKFYLAISRFALQRKLIKRHVRLHVVVRGWKRATHNMLRLKKYLLLLSLKAMHQVLILGVSNAKEIGKHFAGKVGGYLFVCRG